MADARNARNKDAGRQSPKERPAAAAAAAAEEEEEVVAAVKVATGRLVTVFRIIDGKKTRCLVPLPDPESPPLDAPVGSFIIMMCAL